MRPNRLQQRRLASVLVQLGGRGPTANDRELKDMTTETRFIYIGNIPDAKSLAKKLANSKPCQIISVTPEEMEVYAVFTERPDE